MVVDQAAIPSVDVAHFGKSKVVIFRLEVELQRN
jgi:hypothetical protein